MIWAVETEIVHVASEHWMQQIAADVAAAAVNAAAFASLQCALHRLDVGCSRHDLILEGEDDENY